MEIVSKITPNLGLVLQVQMQHPTLCWLKGHRMNAGYIDVLSSFQVSEKVVYHGAAGICLGESPVLGIESSASAFDHPSVYPMEDCVELCVASWK